MLMLCSGKAGWAREIGVALGEWIRYDVSNAVFAATGPVSFFHPPASADLLVERESWI